MTVPFPLMPLSSGTCSCGSAAISGFSQGPDNGLCENKPPWTVTDATDNPTWNNDNCVSACHEVDLQRSFNGGSYTSRSGWPRDCTWDFWNEDVLDGYYNSPTCGYGISRTTQWKVLINLKSAYGGGNCDTYTMPSAYTWSYLLDIGDCPCM